MTLHDQSDNPRIRFDFVFHGLHKQQFSGSVPAANAFEAIVKAKEVWEQTSFPKFQVVRLEITGAIQ